MEEKRLINAKRYVCVHVCVHACVCAHVCMCVCMHVYIYHMFIAAYRHYWGHCAGDLYSVLSVPSHRITIPYCCSEG